MDDLHITHQMSWKSQDHERLTLNPFISGGNISQLSQGLDIVH